MFAHKFGDVETEGFGGGDAARGNMGLFEVAGADELDHFVSDGGGRNTEVVFFVEHLRAHGSGSLDVFFDDDF